MSDLYYKYPKNENNHSFDKESNEFEVDYRHPDHDDLLYPRSYANELSDRNFQDSEGELRSKVCCQVCDTDKMTQ